MRRPSEIHERRLSTVAERDAYDAQRETARTDTAHERVEVTRQLKALKDEAEFWAKRELKL